VLAAIRSSNRSASLGPAPGRIRATFLLYSFLAESIAGIVLPELVLPRGCNFAVRSFWSSMGFFKVLFDETPVENGHFSIRFVPARKCHLFCYRFRVTPLSLPSLLHPLTASELLLRMTSRNIHEPDMCIVIETKPLHFSVIGGFVK
jgi:hypothetical protein